MRPRPADQRPHHRRCRGLTASAWSPKSFPPTNLTARAQEFAGILLSASPTSIARTKRLLLGYDEAALKAELEIAIRENADIRSTADFREGLSSFLEKRAPKWVGQ